MVSLRLHVLVLVTCALVSGCTVGYELDRDASVAIDASRDGGQDTDLCGIDSDGDGIADSIESGYGDVDGDGIANDHDLDSDGDGAPDASEHGAESGCVSLHCDDDSLPNWADEDSDDDGLLDGAEMEHGTDPCDIDTDGDHVTDFAEIAGSMTDPLRPSSTIDPGDFFLILPYEDPARLRTLRFGSTLQVADVYLLVDTTGSMDATLENLRVSLRDDIVPRLRARIPDVQIGVGHHDDFPFISEDVEHPLSSEGYGQASDVAYAHFQDITGDVDLIEAALDRIHIGNGWDRPESQLEALYQTVTGEGGSWEYTAPADGVVTVVPVRRHSIARRTCPVVPDELERRTGYPCFRPNALPIVVLASDANWGGDVSRGTARADIVPPMHQMDAVADAFDRIGARFVSIPIANRWGLPSGGEESAELATRTGSVDASGRALVFPSTYGTVSESVVDGIETLASAVPQDVTTRTSDVQPNPDGFDATRFIRSIRAVEGYRDGIAGVGYASHDETTFYTVIPGTLLDFEVELQNVDRMPAERAQVFRARITVVGNGRAELDRRDVYIVVPGTRGGVPVLM